jgi:hypothetical protein
MRNEDELVSFCLLSKEFPFRRFLSGLSDEEKKIELKKAIRESGIKKDSNGLFHKSPHVFDLYQFFVKKCEKEDGGVTESGEELLDAYPFLNGCPVVVSDDWQQKRFLLLTRSAQFQGEIEQIRKHNNISPQGFSMRSRDYHKWRWARTELQMHELDESLEKLISRKYKIPFEIVFWYLMYGLEFWKSIPNAPHLKEKSTNGPVDILTSDLLIHLHDANTRKNPPDSFHASLKDLFLIAIKRPVSEKELVAFVHRHWKSIKKEMTSFFETVSISEDFERDLAIYDLHQIGKKDREIRAIMKRTGKGDISIAAIKKSHQRFGERIQDIEKNGTRN